MLSSPDSDFFKVFQRPERAARELNLLAQDPLLQESYPEILRQLMQRLPALADPDEALNHLERIFRASTDRSQLCDLLAGNPLAMEVLLAIVGQSQFLSEIVIRRPEYLLWLLRCEDLTSIKRWPHYRREIETWLSGTVELAEAAQALRRYRRREVLRIAVRDILELGSIDDCALELSNLADNITHELCQRIRDDFRKRLGVPLTEQGQEAQFAVIALGKLGGRELNFSSDIDLMFVYDGEGHPSKAAMDNFEYFCRLAAELVKVLSASTDEGYLYRVDTRLRPEGSRGALARSLASLELYYESWGENWERQALLKARPIAGDTPLGERFLEVIKPFTYRKYVDELSIHETLSAMSAMRTKNIQSLGVQESGARFNFKTGPGGIRDVEFIVQAIQMLYGGQYPEIRCAGSVQSIERIRQSGLLSAEDFDALSHGYHFLRRLEHRLQMERELQVYCLPGSRHQQNVLAKRLGYPSWAEFLQDYRRYTWKIRAIFEGIFAPFAKVDLFEAVLDEHQGDSRLHSFGFSEPRLARTILAKLSQDPQTPHLNPKVRRLFRQIVPRLLDNLRKSPAPDLGLRSFERIVSAVGARSSLYTTLAADRQFLELLVSLGSHSQYLTDILVRFPALLDRLADPEFLHQPITSDRLKSDYRQLAAALKAADAMNALRRLKQVHLLKAGLRYLLRLSDVSGLTAELAALAAFVLDELLQVCMERYLQRYGTPVLPGGAPCGLAVIGMGKLGGGELNFTSDLDLLFVYEDDGGRVIAPVEAGQSIGVKEFFVRLAGDMLNALSSPTRDGLLYRADVRLRPYGKGGDLAGTLKQYRDYYQREAALWERQALTKARWIAGDAQTGRQFLEQAAEFVYSSGLTRQQRRDIAHLRGRIERERKGEELKSGEGGLIDVEFLVQAHLLEHGKDHPAVRHSNTLEALNALVQEGLIDTAQGQTLANHYLFLRDIENRLQIMDGISIDDLPSDPPALQQLVRRMYHLSQEPAPTSQEFLARYERCRKEIRSIYERYFSQE